MMRTFNLIISYAFHPLFVPTYGTLFYLLVTPKYSPPDVKLGIIVPVAVLTLFIPLLGFVVLRQLGALRSLAWLPAGQRVYPLLIYLTLLLFVVVRVISKRYTEELYFFFLAMALVNATCLLLALGGRVVSLHMAGMGSLLMFLVALSLHFEKNIVAAVSLCTLATGILASARLYLKAYGRASVLTGWLIGLLSQLLLLRFWL
jgi:hypothetical protein